MLIVTIAALVMAASLGWFAYRLMQEEQRRSEARVAVLTAALQDTPDDVDPPSRPGPVGFIAPSAVQPSVAVPPVTRADVRAAEPELVYLEDDSRPAQWFRSERPEVTWEPPVPPRAEAAPAPPADDLAARPSGLFADVPEARPADARGAIALGGVVLVGALALGYVFFGRPEPTVPAAVPPAVATSAAAATSPVQGGMPLELVSLGHEQRTGALIVRGVVRNPVSGSDRTGLVASVMLLDQAGGFLGSGRAPIETTRLRAGDSVGFAVELPAHKDVRRYRVTFRGVDGALVAHVDRRAVRP